MSSVKQHRLTNFFYWLNHQKLQGEAHTFITKVSVVSVVGCYEYRDIIKCFFGILLKIMWFGKGFKNMSGYLNPYSLRLLVSSAYWGFKNGCLTVRLCTSSVYFLLR